MAVIIINAVNRNYSVTITLMGLDFDVPTHSFPLRLNLAVSSSLALCITQRSVYYTGSKTGQEIFVDFFFNLGVLLCVRRQSNF